MKVLVFDAAEIGRQAARIVADALRAAIADRGRASAAFSGGRTPGAMLHALAEEDLSWDRIDVFQVDERIAPPGDPARNWNGLADALSARLRPSQLHAMPVEAADLTVAAANYCRALAAAGGGLDLVHLGLGDDGHTASLVPGDPVLNVIDRDVAISAPYQGHRRMTLTFPALNRAQNVLWLVTGAAKAGVLQRLVAADRTIPAGRVRAKEAVVVADRDAAQALAAIGAGH